MSLLDKLLKETTTAGAVAGGDVANARGRLFADQAETKSKKKKTKMRKHNTQPKEVAGVKIIRYNTDSRVGKHGFMLEADEQGSDTTFDPADVISKLKNAEKKLNNERDTVAFGMEDDQGNVVKIHVPSEQAEDFENALQTLLSGHDDESDEVYSDFEDNQDNQESEDTPEIAEVLFKLKDRFDIIDAEWPEIEEDEEEVENQEEVEGEEGDQGDEEDMEGEGDEEDPEAEDMDDMEGDEEDPEADEDLEGEEGADEMEAEEDGQSEVASALDAVISMLKKDAEARQAEAEAREAEAEAAEAKAAAQAAQAKVSQEEEVLDMEAYYDKQKKEKDEAERLKKLAKYRHDVAQNAKEGGAEAFGEGLEDLAKKNRRLLGEEQDPDKEDDTKFAGRRDDDDTECPEEEEAEKDDYEDPDCWSREKFMDYFYTHLKSQR